MRQKEMLRKILAALGLAASLLLMAKGYVTMHNVREMDSDEIAKELEIPHPFSEISNIQLIIDATFGGVTLREGHLYSTYDRSVIVDKRACPT